jgi:hypothetical protein
VVDCPGERDAIAEIRDRNVLLGSGPDQLGAARGLLHALPPSPGVRVSGCPVPIPESALDSGLEYLVLATEGYVGLRDYAEAVALTLAVLVKRGIVIFPD